MPSSLTSSLLDALLAIVPKGEAGGSMLLLVEGPHKLLCYCFQDIQASYLPIKDSCLPSCLLLLYSTPAALSTLRREMLIVGLEGAVPNVGFTCDAIGQDRHEIVTPNIHDGAPNPKGPRLTVLFSR